MIRIVKHDISDRIKKYQAEINPMLKTRLRALKLSLTMLLEPVESGSISQSNYKLIIVFLKLILHQRGISTTTLSSIQSIHVLAQKIRGNRSVDETEVRQYLQFFEEIEERELSGIVCEMPNQLFALNNRIVGGINSETLELINTVFDYGSLGEVVKKHVDSLEVKYCPYCNVRDTETIKNEEGKRTARPSIDHFFNQDNYPLLQVSFYNLIPSCDTCNETNKRTVQFSLDYHLHPYLNEFGNDATFSTVPDSQYKRKFRVILLKKCDTTSPEYLRIWGDGDPERGSVTVFDLENLYATKSDMATKIVTSFDENSPFYIGSIDKYMKMLKTSPEELYDYIVDGSYNKDNFTDKAYSKAKHDIYHELLSKMKIAR